MRLCSLRVSLPPATSCHFSLPPTTHPVGIVAFVGPGRGKKEAEGGPAGPVGFCIIPSTPLARLFRGEEGVGGSVTGEYGGGGVRWGWPLAFGVVLVGPPNRLFCLVVF